MAAAVVKRRVAAAVVEAGTYPWIYHQAKRTRHMLNTGVSAGTTILVFCNKEGQATRASQLVKTIVKLLKYGVNPNSFCSLFCTKRTLF